MKNFELALKAIELLFVNIENMSKVRKLLICIVTFIVIIGSFVHFLYRPKFERLDQLNSEHKNLGERLVDTKKTATYFNKYRTKIKAAEANYKIAMKALPDKKEITSLLTNISQYGIAAGLEFLLFQPESEINKDFYTEIPVSIKVAGNYHKVKLFFDKISRLSRIVNIKDILMAKSKERDILNISFTAITYRFIDAEEKEKQENSRNF